MRRLLQLVGLGFGLMLSMTPASAVDFRIDTKLFSAGNKIPTGQNLTLFANGVVYDFARELNEQGEPGTNQEIAILDTARLRFVLLDTARRAKTEIDCKDLGDFVERLRLEGLKGEQPAVKFAASPQFTENFDRKAGLLTLTSGVIDYSVKTTRPESVAASDQYGQFADMYAQLNTTHPGAAPPFPRMYLNAVLVKHGVVPTRVERTISGPGSQKLTAWTEHQVSWQLTKTDRQQMDQADRYQHEFKVLSFGEYRQIGPMKK